MMININHISTDKRELCSGCGVCAHVCPTEAIQYIYDDEGYLSPIVDETHCINCGICMKNCHLQSDTAPNKKSVSGQYAAKMKDEHIRMNSRSGGIFVALSDFVLDQGGVVYGAVSDGRTRVSHFRAETKNERNRMCGSKYVQSDTCGIYEHLKNDVIGGRMVLFTGTPCQIGAVARFMGKEYDNLYLCDFVCHGVPSQKLWQDYISYMEKKYKRTVTDFDFRDKREHKWESHVEKLVMGEKIVYSRRYTNIFCSNNCLRRSCYECQYTTMERVSDFTMADYWGIDDIAPEFNDSKGVSLLLIRGKKGEVLFDAVKNRLNLIDTKQIPPIHYNLRRPTAMPETHDAFWKDYAWHGFGYVSAKYGGYDILRKIKYKIIDKID